MINKLKYMLTEAIDTAYRNDHDLFTRGGLEQSCVFRIGYYLQKLIDNDNELHNYNLDCEYNKNGYNSKTTPRFPKGTRPDLILHERTSNQYNLLMVEFKGWWSKKSRNDHLKLEDFTSLTCGYQYKLGAYVILGKENSKITYFIDGRQIDSTS